MRKMLDSSMAEDLPCTSNINFLLKSGSYYGHIEVLKTDLARRLARKSVHTATAEVVRYFA